MTMRILQISDLHFGREIPELVEALLADVRRVEPQLVAVCGDLTQTAREREFRSARSFLDSLTAPTIVVPGNHDLPGWRIWSRFTRPWRRWRRHILDFDPKATKTLSVDGLVVVGVNTARGWGHHPDWSRGRINLSQVDAVVRAFRQAPSEDLRVLVTHHPFLLTEAERSRGHVGRLQPALRKLRHETDLLLGGHTHHAYNGLVAGVVAAQSGTPISDRLKGEANSYNLIEAEGNRLEVTIRRWTGTRFEPHGCTAYHRRGTGWRTAG